MAEPVERREPPLGADPRQARGIEKRRRVYDEALRAYAAHGVERAKTEDIVAAAGVSWGTFFNYFPRKEDVLLAAAVDLHEIVETAIHDERARGGGVGEAIAGGYAELAAWPYPASLLAEVMREVIARGERLEAMLRRHDHRPLWVTIADVLAIGQIEGSVRADVDADALARLLNLTMVASFTRVGARGDVGLPASLDLVEYGRTTLDMLWRGIGTPEEGTKVQS